MNVADFWFQHSPIFGHCALSHTVCRFSSRAIFFRLWKVSPIGAFAFSHAGLAAGFLGVRSICTSSAFNWISDEATGGVIPSIVSVRLKTAEPHQPQCKRNQSGTRYLATA